MVVSETKPLNWVEESPLFIDERSSLCNISEPRTLFPSSGLILSPSPSWDFVRSSQDGLSWATLSSHLPVSGAAGTGGKLGSEPLRTFSVPQANSVVMGEESTSFPESWEKKQPGCGRQLQEASEQRALVTSSCSVFCSAPPRCHLLRPTVPRGEAVDLHTEAHQESGAMLNPCMDAQSFLFLPSTMGS